MSSLALRGYEADTPSGFCAVIDVIAEVPYTLFAANVIKSACMPAPPPESLPAMVSATGVSLGVTALHPVLVLVEAGLTGASKLVARSLQASVSIQKAFFS